MPTGCETFDWFREIFFRSAVLAESPTDKAADEVALRQEERVEWFLTYTRRTRHGMVNFRRWTKQIPLDELLSLLNQFPGFT